MKEFPDTYSVGHYSRFQIVILLSFGSRRREDVCKLAARELHGAPEYTGLCFLFFLKFELVTKFKMRKTSHIKNPRPPTLS